MKPRDLAVSVANEFDETSRYGLSVFSLPDLTADQLAAEIVKTHRLPHQVIRESTVGAIRGLGYEVVPDDSPHALVLFADEPSDADWSALLGVFSSPRENPVR